MIATISPAFEFLRQHKQVSAETESLVMKRLKGRISQDDLMTSFENGITGQYGKVYALDPQTLIGWAEAFQKGRNSSKSYLETGLLNPAMPYFEYSNDDWNKEANKCFTAFLNGVNESHFHPRVYDRMMLDGKINLNACMKYLKGDYQESEVTAAKQKVLRDCFLTFKSNGWSFVYYVK